VTHPIGTPELDFIVGRSERPANLLDEVALGPVPVVELERFLPQAAFHPLQQRILAVGVRELQNDDTSHTFKVGPSIHLGGVHYFAYVQGIGIAHFLPYLLREVGEGVDGDESWALCSALDF